MGEISEKTQWNTTGGCECTGGHFDLRKKGSSCSLCNRGQKEVTERERTGLVQEWRLKHIGFHHLKVSFFSATNLLLLISDL